MALDDKTRTELEAAAFRRLVEHLRTHADVQNLDLMNLAGFCRNCLSKWYRAAAEEKGVALTDPAARARVPSRIRHTETRAARGAIERREMRPRTIVAVAATAAC